MDSEKREDRPDGGAPEEDFEALFEASQAVSEAAAGAAVTPGELVKGKVVSVGKDGVFVALGGKTEGHIELSELTPEDGGEPTVSEGDELEAYVISAGETVQLSLALAKSARTLEALATAYDAGIPVEGKVVGLNKGGVEVKLGGTRAFCPRSQLDRARVDFPADFVGQTLQFLITDFSENGRNIVVSRRRLMEEEAAQMAEEARTRVVEGAELKGRVRNIRDFGVFVDLGGVDGLVHISELSWGRVENPAEVVSVGEEVTVRVLKADWERNRISLTMRSEDGDPWHTAVQEISAGATMTGKVARLTEYGAFVELRPGLDGLVHVSEISWDRVRNPSDLLSPGQEVTVKVLALDTERKRVSLSIRQVDSDPWATARDRFPEGKVVEGEVEKIESFGVFVRLSPGIVGLIPVSESGTEKGSDLRRAFEPNTTVKAMVLSVNPEEHRLSLSVRALQETDERGAVEGYLRDQQRSTGSRKAEKGASFGTFGDLLRDKLDKLED